jgi:hypothetical protein
MRGLWTTYDACVTTALFLIGLDHLAQHGDHAIARRYRRQIDLALGYLHAHLYADVFHEDPTQCGADRFALKVTYWKDSELNVAGDRREPRYPVAYALAHFQCTAAMRAAARLTRSATRRSGQKG